MNFRKSKKVESDQSDVDDSDEDIQVPRIKPLKRYDDDDDSSSDDEEDKEIQRKKKEKEKAKKQAKKVPSIKVKIPPVVDERRWSSREKKPVMVSAFILANLKLSWSQ